MYPCVSFAQQNHTSVTHNSESYQSNIIAFEHANERQPNCQENNIRHTLSCNAINTGLFYVLHIARSLSVRPSRTLHVACSARFANYANSCTRSVSVTHAKLRIKRIARTI